MASEKKIEIYNGAFSPTTKKNKKHLTYQNWTSIFMHSTKQKKHLVFISRPPKFQAQIDFHS
jgi:hypothetical protein